MTHPTTMMLIFASRDIAKRGTTAYRAKVAKLVAMRTTPTRNHRRLGVGGSISVLSARSMRFPEGAH